MHIPGQVVFGALAVVSQVLGYQVKTPPLDTEWTYKVGTNPWPEYPRPLLQRPQWQNLNGIWKYRRSSAAEARMAPVNEVSTRFPRVAPTRKEPKKREPPFDMPWLT